MLKFKRAKEHVSILRAEIAKACPDGEFLPIRREYDAARSAFVYRIERVINAPDYWGPIAADAIHNFRCALDHLAWQLAIRHYHGVVPTDKNVIKQIQFPVVLDETKWPYPPNINRKHMNDADADKLENFQPFKMNAAERAAGMLHPLESLAGFDGLSNIVKHRTQLTYVIPSEGYISVPPLDEFRDCQPILNTSGGFDAYYTAPGQPPNAGEEVLRIPITVTGPNPHVDFKARLTGFITVRDHWDLWDTLNAFEELVFTVLREFEPVVKSRLPSHEGRLSRQVYTAAKMEPLVPLQ